jgi:hypothetical protein
MTADFLCVLIARVSDFTQFRLIFIALRHRFLGRFGVGIYGSIEEVFG